MTRTVLGSLAGAVIGFLVGCAGVNIAASAHREGDVTPAVVLVGSFLAGTGAIAGAIAGGVADLRKHLGSKALASNETPDQAN